MSDKKTEKAAVPAVPAGESRYTVSYGCGVVVFPSAAVERFPLAEKRDIAVLTAMLRHPGATLAQLADDCALEIADVTASAAFWRGAGVIICETEADGNASAAKTAAPDGKSGKEAAGAEAPKKAAKKSVKTDDVIPHYTTEELTELVGKDGSMVSLIDECERLLGKIFSTAETSKLVGLIDYLGLDASYVMCLCAHCSRIGKKSLRYVETTAMALYDRGITDVETLDEHLHVIEEAAKTEAKIRSMFGMNMHRALTKREQGYIEDWVGKFGYDIDIIRRAYEITVNNTKEPSMAYANAILESWFGAGLRTGEEIDEKIAEDAEPATLAGKSFDSDDFFEAALRRSYGEGNEIPEIPKAPSGGEGKTGKRRK